jgi:ankyrin repeat protein
VSLHDAALSGDYTLLAQLLQCADLERPCVFAQDVRGNTPLHLAAARGSVQCVTILIQADLERVALRTPNALGELPLHVAVRRGDTPCARVMMETLANLPAQYMNGDRISAVPAFRGDKLWDAPDASGLTPLHIAIGNSSFLLGAMLLSFGVNVDTKDKHGNTALHYATYKSVGAVKMLLLAGADVNTVNGYTDTPLHIAARTGEIPVVYMLLHYKANTRALNVKLNTPIHEAVLAGHLVTVQILLQADRLAALYLNADRFNAIVLAMYLGHNDISSAIELALRPPSPQMSGVKRARSVMQDAATTDVLSSETCSV